VKVDFAFLCDYAEVTRKVNALGIGFDTIHAAQTPCKHRHFSVVIQLRASVVEAGQKNVAFHLIDEDGKDIIPPVTGQFTIPRPKGATESIGRFVMEFGNIEFPRYGSYSVRVTLEGMELAVLSFRVSPLPSPPSQ